LKTLQKLGLAAVLAASVSTAMASPHGHGFKFKTVMSPAQSERLGTDGILVSINSDATGSAKLSFSKDLSSVTYTVNAFNTATGVGAAHFHCASAETRGNGPAVIVVSNPGADVPFNNVNSGPITLTNAGLKFVPADSVCGIEINNIASLLQATLKGLIYINIHPAEPTDGLPGSGELRGQFFKPVRR